MKGLMQAARLTIQNKWLELCFGKRENSINTQINKITGMKFTNSPKVTLGIQLRSAWLKSINGKKEPSRKIFLRNFGIQPESKIIPPRESKTITITAQVTGSNCLRMIRNPKTIIKGRVKLKGSMVANPRNIPASIFFSVKIKLKLSIKK
jgi:hypothetical protein